MKKYIFLDIDGVIATEKEFWTNKRNFMKKHEWAAELSVPYPFNAKAVKVFNEILEATGAEIIISSDWKLHWTLEQLDVIFKANGVIKSPIDQTPTVQMFTSMLEKIRLAEIEQYLREHKFIDETADVVLENWVIIDDLNFRGWMPESMQDRFFLTSSGEGIKRCGLKEKIIKKLNSYDNVAEK